MAPLINKTLAKHLFMLNEAIRSNLEGSTEEKIATMNDIFKNNHTGAIAPKDGQDVRTVIHMLPNNCSYIVGDGYWVETDKKGNTTEYDEKTIFIYMDASEINYPQFVQLLMSISLYNEQISFLSKPADGDDETAREGELVYTGINPPPPKDPEKLKNYKKRYKGEREDIGTVHYNENNPYGHTILNGLKFTFK